MYLLKKAFSLALDPFLVALALLLAALLLSYGRGGVRRAGRRLLGGATTLLLLSSLWPVAYRLNLPLENDHPVAAVGGLDSVPFIAVLGGGHMAQPTRPATHWLSDPSRNRLLEGIRLVKAQEKARLIVSGAGPWAVPHAEVAARAAASLGVPPERIMELPRPRDTAEELSAIARVVAEKPFFLVTSANHLPRALAAARRRGLNAIPAPAAFTPAPSGGWYDWVPDADALEATEAALHEYVGRIWYRLMDRTS